MSMVRILVYLFGLSVTGCGVAALQPPNTSDVREIMVQDNADVAYQKALRSVLRLGGSVTQANPQARVISAVVKVAIIAGILMGSSMQ